MNNISFTNRTSSLPIADLKEKYIPQRLLNIIPSASALKYLALFFEEDENTLKLAIGHPEKLKPNISNALENLGKKLNKKVVIYQADSKEILDAIGRSTSHPPLDSNLSKKQPETLKNIPPQFVTLPKPENIHPSPVLPPTTSSLLDKDQKKEIPPLPKLYIQGEIPYSVFSHIPYLYSLNHKIICIDFVAPNIFSITVQKDNLKGIEYIANYIEKKNQVKINLYSASEREFNFLVGEYKKARLKLSVEEKKKADSAPSFFSLKPKKTKKPKPVIQEKEKYVKPNYPETEEQPIKELPTILEQKLSADVVKPEIQGNILSKGKEKRGFGGALEKLSSFLNPPKPELADNIDLKPELGGLEEKVSIPEIKKEVKPISTPEEQIEKEKPQILSQSPETKIVPETKEPQKISETKLNTQVVKEEKKTPEETPKVDETPKVSVATEKKETVQDQNDLGKLIESDISSIEDLKKIVKENNIPKIVAAVVSYAISMNASDIHIEPFEDELLIRFRIDGQLRNIIKLPPDMHAPLVSRIKILSRLKLDETRIPQDGRFDVKFASREVDLRVSTMPAVHGEKGVLRILDKSKGIISLESLGVEGDGFDVLIQSINKPYGIIMATGPTGSGKSTTLYAILARVATSNVNVITLEDPVEYEMKGVNQSQINPKIGYTFADGLRSILRQDPNIIMVGEIRDGETANMATQAALTGHLVLSTLHTNDASGALPRLINMGIEPFLITSSINAIIGQRLVRKICENCRQEVQLPAGVVKGVDEELAKISPNNKKDRARIKQPYKFYEGKGCNKCNNSGYSGRMGVYEILPMSDAIEELTIEHATATQLLNKATSEGMITMKQDGLLKVLAGITALDEVLRETSNK